MRALLNIVVDACEHSELITLIQSEEPSLYTNFGFRMIYKRVQYTLTRADCKRTTNFGCGYNPTAIDLLKVYSAFISRFNGYYARDLEYFVKYINEIRAQGGKIVAYFNGKDQIQGYASMIPMGDELVVEELIYLDSMKPDKSKYGPYSEGELAALIKQEILGENDYIWMTDLEGWLKVGSSIYAFYLPKNAQPSIDSTLKL